MVSSATTLTGYWKSVTARLELASADQHEQIDELMQGYLRELAAYTDEIEFESGRYRYPYLPFYWQDPDRFPYLIFAEDILVGFVLTRRDTDPADGTSWMEIAELYIKAPHRRSGIAQSIVTALWKEPGEAWHIGVLAKNLPAYKFWKQIIEARDSMCRELPVSSHGQIVFQLTT